MARVEAEVARRRKGGGHLADLGKGVLLHVVPPEWPLYIVEVKAGRTDLFYRAGDRIVSARILLFGFCERRLDCAPFEWAGSSGLWGGSNQGQMWSLESGIGIEFGTGANDFFAGEPGTECHGVRLATSRLMFVSFDLGKASKAGTKTPRLSDGSFLLDST
jgi:hypothetical protein